MSVLGNLAREFFRTMEPVFRRDLVSQQERRLQPVQHLPERVAAVVRLAQYRDAFEHLPVGREAPFALDGRAAGRAQQSAAEAPVDFSRAERSRPTPMARALLEGDSFAPARRAPVDLSGGLKLPISRPALETRPAPLPSNGFLASLADLG